MRHVLLPLAIISLSLFAFACGGTEGTEAAQVCAQVTCPTGTAAVMTAEASSACSGGVSGERGLTSVGLSASAACMGEGECAIACEPVSECCGGESWTEGSYTCETPCSAACSCAGKCGTVTGPGCSAECGNCSGNQSCLDNECVDACPDDVTTCGAGVCCDSGTAICVAGECCDPVANCTGRACGDDGCGGDCEALGAGWGCKQNEVCENYQCVENTDCGGSLPVCELGPAGEATGQIRNCGADGKWADGPDCALNELGKTVCVMTSAGAVCAECGDDDDCSDGGICVVKPGGAECAECTEDVDCQSSEAGQACKNGKCGCSSNDDCATGQECVGGLCEGAACDPSVICDPEDGPKRYCGDDGCGGFCGDKDWTCNGIGVCTDEGQCESKDSFACKFQPQGDQPPVEIPWGMPFCNSMIPNMDTKAPPYDPNLPGEAVVSCNWSPPTEQSPDEYGCVCSLHVEDDQPEGLNCSAQQQLCRSKLEGWDNLNADNTLADFECLEPTTCTEYMSDKGVEGYADGTWLCNTGYTDDYPEGWIVYCEDDNGLPRFRCAECEKEDDGGEWSTCDSDGIQCYPKDNDGDGVIDSAACEVSKADWCPQADGTPGTNWAPGCCYADDEGCQGEIGEGQNWIDEGPPEFKPEENPDHEYIALPHARSCVYDPETNVVTSVILDCAAEGKICQNHAAEGQEALIGTCVTPVEPCPDGHLYQRWCNAQGDDFDEAYPEGSVLFCAVDPYLQTKTVEALSCTEWQEGHPNADVEGEDPGACAGESAPEFKLLCLDQDGGAVCQQDRSSCCDVITPLCQDGAPQTCAYDPTSNAVLLEVIEGCQDGEVCVDIVYNSPGGPEPAPGDPEPGFSQVPAECQVIETCPDGSDNHTWCNPPEGDANHMAEYPIGAKIHCSVLQPGNSKSISGETCQAWADDGANGAFLDPSYHACGTGSDSVSMGYQLEPEMLAWICVPGAPDAESGEAHASCEQSRAGCCEGDGLMPPCESPDTPTACAYDPNTNTVTFEAQDPCDEGFTCVDTKYEFWHLDSHPPEASAPMNDPLSVSPEAQAATCEEALSCPYGAEWPNEPDEFCNPPEGEEGHIAGYQGGEVMKCLYVPESNQLRYRGLDCGRHLLWKETGDYWWGDPTEVPGTIEYENQNVAQWCPAPGAVVEPDPFGWVPSPTRNCCTYDRYACIDVPGAEEGTMVPQCGVDSSGCCDADYFYPGCIDNAPAECVIPEGGVGPVQYQAGEACAAAEGDDPGEVCVEYKHDWEADMLGVIDEDSFFGPPWYDTGQGAGPIDQHAACEPKVGCTVGDNAFTGVGDYNQFIARSCNRPAEEDEGAGHYEGYAVGALIECLYHGDTNELQIREVACDGGRACVDRKYTDPLSLEGMYEVEASCETPNNCPYTAAEDQKYCNVEGSAGYNAEWGDRVIECARVVETNQLAWGPSQDAPCTPDETCFPGGSYTCEWCKRTADGDLLGGPNMDAAEMSTHPDPSGVQSAGCALPQACPKDDICHPDNGLVSCEYDPDTNQLDFSFSACQGLEACVSYTNEGPPYGTYDTPEDPMFWGSCVDPGINAECNIWSNPEGSYGVCQDTACGDPYHDIFLGDPEQGHMMSASCGDPTKYQCYEDTDGEWENALDDDWTPHYGCLPMQLKDFPDGASMLEIPLSAIHSSGPQPWEGEVQIGSAVAFCNNTGTADGLIFKRNPDAFDTGPPVAPPDFVVWGWVKDDPFDEFIMTDLEPDHVYAAQLTEEWTIKGSQACSACAIEAQCSSTNCPETTTLRERAIKCCLAAHDVSIFDTPTPSTNEAAFDALFEEDGLCELFAIENP